MNPPDLSTRLKLMGVDVASFGDYFADVRTLSPPTEPASTPAAPAAGLVAIHTSAKRRYLTNDNGPVKCLTYHDPFSATYKKYIFSSDGRHLIGGMMIGDVGDFTKLVAITKKKKSLDVPPSQFILGSRTSGDDDGDDLDDDTVICSCHVSQRLSPRLTAERDQSCYRCQRQGWSEELCRCQEMHKSRIGVWWLCTSRHRHHEDGDEEGRRGHRQPVRIST